MIIHSFDQIAIQLYFSRLTPAQNIATGHARKINRISQRIPKMGFLDAILMVVGSSLCCGSCSLVVVLQVDNG